MTDPLVIFVLAIAAATVSAPLPIVIFGTIARVLLGREGDQ